MYGATGEVITEEPRRGSSIPEGKIIAGMSDAEYFATAMPGGEVLYGPGISLDPEFVDYSNIIKEYRSEGVASWALGGREGPAFTRSQDSVRSVLRNPRGEGSDAIRLNNMSPINPDGASGPAGGTGILEQQRRLPTDTLPRPPQDEVLITPNPDLSEADEILDLDKSYRYHIKQLPKTCHRDPGTFQVTASLPRGSRLSQQHQLGLQHYQPILED